MTPETKSALLTLFIAHVAPVLFTGLAMLLGWVLTQLGRKLGAQAGESKLAAVGTRFTLFAQAVVADLEATLKPELAKATADGELTQAEIAHLRTIALARLKALAGEKGLGELQAVIGIAAPQVDAFLSGLIERAVATLPRDAAPTLAASPQ